MIAGVHAWGGEMHVTVCLVEHHFALKVSVEFLAVLKRGEWWTSFYLFEPFVHRSIFTEVLMVWNCFQDKTAQR